MAASYLLHPTTTVFPASQATAQSCSLPLGVFISPHLPSPSLRTVSYGLDDVIRCESCGGYLNPFVTWVAAGRAWLCPLCKSRNAVRDDFYQPLNEEGRRRDERNRPDLWEMQYEIVAPESYIERPPVAPAFCFLLDCSTATQASGLLDAFCSVLSDVLTSEAFPGLPRTRISFILFTSEVHLVVFSHPSVSLISLNRATETAFLPVPKDRILATVADCPEAVSAAIAVIRKVGSRGTRENSAMRMALMYAHSVLHGEGGRAILVTSDYDSSSGAKQSEKDGFPCSDPWYQNIAKEFRAMNIACDVFLSASRFADLGSIAYLAESSCGQLFFYPNLTPHQNEKVATEVYLSLTRSSLWDGAIRLRVNPDWKAVQAFGSFHIRAGDLFSVPCFSPSHSLLYRLELEDPIVKQGKVYIQAAVMYTSDEGERRIRVATAAIKVSAEKGEVIAGGIQENIAAMWAKQAVVHSLQVNDAGAGCSFIEKQLRGVRDACEGRQFPANLAFLPYYCFGLTKLPLFSAIKPQKKGENSLGNDQSAVVRYEIVCGAPEIICQIAYPRLYSLSDVIAQEEIQLQPLNLCIDSLTKAGIYCLDTVFELLIWASDKHIGPEVAAETLAALFGNALRVPTEKDISERCSDQAERVKEVLSRLRCAYGRFQTLTVFTHGNPQELTFFAKMIEDSPAQPPTFSVFLSSI